MKSRKMIELDDKWGLGSNRRQWIIYKILRKVNEETGEKEIYKTVPSYFFVTLDKAFDKYRQVAIWESSYSSFQELIDSYHEVRNNIIDKLQEVDAWEKGSLQCEVNELQEENQRLEEKIRNLKKKLSELEEE